MSQDNLNHTCGKKAPSQWEPQGLTCILYKGHPITKKTGHKLKDGRVWPVGKQNKEWA